MINQSLCPTYQTECPKALWLDLDGDIEVLGWVRACHTLCGGIKPGQSHTLRTEQRLSRVSEQEEEGFANSQTAHRNIITPGKPSVFLVR
jgi:hypothetical protein